MSVPRRSRKDLTRFFVPSKPLFRRSGAYLRLTRTTFLSANNEQRCEQLHVGDSQESYHTSCHVDTVRFPTQHASHNLLDLPADAWDRSYRAKKGLAASRNCGSHPDPTSSEFGQISHSRGTVSSTLWTVIGVLFKLEGRRVIDAALLDGTSFAPQKRLLG